MSKIKVVVGMSGGVDSSVAAYILKKQGYEVIGITMQIWGHAAPEDDSGGCCGISAVEDARRVCHQLDIPHYVMNFRQDFEKHVINYFVEEYHQGRTPNPCISCNRYVKWESMLGKAIQLGAKYIATGHYARITKDRKTGRYVLAQSATQSKDQTYALYNLTQHQLAHTIMPLGDYTKDEIRDIAKEIDLLVADKPDSQDICFIPDNDYGKFIRENSETKILPGNFIDTEGRILGKHNGIIHYTIGQRRGLGIQSENPLYVVQIKPKTNEVVLGRNDDVFNTQLYASNLNFMPFDRLQGEVSLSAKIRYSHKAALCNVKMIDEDLMECNFKEPQRAITPGQAIVLYDGDTVVGGGTILGTVNNS